MYDYLCELDLHIGRSNDFICRILYLYAALLARTNSGQNKNSIAKPFKSNMSNIEKLEVNYLKIIIMEI